VFWPTDGPIQELQAHQLQVLLMGADPVPSLAWRLRMPTQTRVAPTVYELHVELENLHPPIWRRILVPGSIKLSKLHGLQRAMG
jgi:Plasmid pRiA4b ORF-3-like protein